MTEYMRYLHGNFTPSQMVTNGNFWIYCCEMVLLVIGVIANIMLIITFLSTSAIHLNLRILLNNCSVGFISMAVGRAMIAIPLCIAHWKDVDISNHIWCYTANSVHHSSADCVCLSYVFIMFERVAGTILTKEYEKTSFHLFTFFFAFLQWAIPCSMIIGSFFDRSNRMQIFYEYPHLPCQIEYLTPKMFMVTMVLIVVGFFISIIGMTMIYQTNIRKYNRKDLWFQYENLSERYQISENIRSTNLLFPLMTLMLLFSILCVSVIIYGSYWIATILEDPTSYGDAAKMFGRGGEAAQIFDILTALYTISYPICAIKCHPNLTKKFRFIFLSKHGAIRPANMAEDIRGYEMTTAPSRQRSDYHFDELNRIWNETGPL